MSFGYQIQVLGLGGKAPLPAEPSHWPSHLKNIVFKDLFILISLSLCTCVCVCAHTITQTHTTHMYVHIHTHQSPGVRVTGVWKMLELGAGTWTRSLCKSTKYSEQLLATEPSLEASQFLKPAFKEVELAPSHRSRTFNFLCLCMMWKQARVSGFLFVCFCLWSWALCLANVYHDRFYLALQSLPVLPFPDQGDTEAVVWHLCWWMFHTSSQGERCFHVCDVCSVGTSR